MKRICVILAALAVSLSASAFTGDSAGDSLQVAPVPVDGLKDRNPIKPRIFAGMSFDINYVNSGTVFTDNTRVNDSETYGVNLSPQFGIACGENFMAGMRLGFTMDKTNKLDLYDVVNAISEGKDWKDVKKQTVEKNIGWNIDPFVRYRIMSFGKNQRWGVWAEAHAYFGMEFPNQKVEYPIIQYKREFIYGVQLMPVVSFDVNKTTSVMLHLALLSVGYAGAYRVYDDYSEFDNKMLLFTGKLSGLFNATYTEGMLGLKVGLCRRF